MKNPRLIARRRQSFTLVELLVVIAIIALLGTLALPNFELGIRKAQSAKCETNLRGIGAAVLSWANDNGNVYPEINQAATNVYGSSVPGLVGVLGTYGVSTNTIQCPVDLGTSPSSFQTYGSSYEWRPVLDDGSDPVTTLPVGPVTISVNSARIRICTDFLPVHNGRMNALYGDGHTRMR